MSIHRRKRAGPDPPGFRGAGGAGPRGGGAGTGDPPPNEGYPSNPPQGPPPNEGWAEPLLPRRAVCEALFPGAAAGSRLAAGWTRGPHGPRRSRRLPRAAPPGGHGAAPQPPRRQRAPHGPPSERTPRGAAERARLERRGHKEPVPLCRSGRSSDTCRREERLFIVLECPQTHRPFTRRSVRCRGQGRQPGRCHKPRRHKGPCPRCPQPPSALRRLQTQHGPRARRAGAGPGHGRRSAPPSGRARAPRRDRVTA
ncbi:basic salivary proline-rich protein 3-like [Melospiza georgiana]|uniref:basic salivary proline-rich protein 3-like n=1 Tax=Melospiza georgiana TaxID=44398 RepID=UPI0025AC0B60|nr:basic salivary proline-rich protein 3-like [Melospiza georgiana]